MRACEDVGEGAGPGKQLGGVLLGVVLDGAVFFGRGGCLGFDWGRTWMTGLKVGEFASWTVTTSPFASSMPGRGEAMDSKKRV